MNYSALYRKSMDYIRDVLKKELPEDAEVYLFGSRAKGDFSHRSDIDIGILSRNITKKNIICLTDEFDESFVPFKVDIIDLSSVSQNFKQEVMKGAVKWI